MQKNFIYFVAVVTQTLIVHPSTLRAIVPPRLVSKAFLHRLKNIRI